MGGIFRPIRIEKKEVLLDINVESVVRQSNDGDETLNISVVSTAEMNVKVSSKGPLDAYSIAVVEDSVIYLHQVLLCNV